MTRYLPVLLAVAGLAGVPGHAQEPAPPGRAGEGPPQHRRLMERPGPRQGGPLERFLGQLAQENPEEFERIQQLREQDPGRLHEILQARRNRLRAQQMLNGLAELPRFREVIESLTPEERAQLQEKFQEKFRRFAGGRPDGRMGMRRPPGDHRPGNEAAGQIRQLLRTYREAPEEEKEALRKELRSHLERSFDQEETERQRNIEEVEGRLEKLKQILDARARNRQGIIERRLLELTEGDPMNW